MEDAELRGKLLTTFFELRRNADGWVPASDMNLSGADHVSLQVVGGICQQLADAGMARITGHGVDVVEGSRLSSIDVKLPNAVQLNPSPAPGFPMARADNDDKEAREAVTEEALTEIRTTLATIKAQIASVTLSNTAKAEIDADIKQIEAEAERPNPRHRFMKLYLESLRDNLAKAAGVGTVAALVTAVGAVGALIAKYFGAL